MISVEEALSRLLAPLERLPIEQISIVDGLGCVLAEDLAARRTRCEAVGVRIANEIGYPEYRELQLHPRDVGAAMLSFSWQEGARAPGGPWHPAAYDGTRPPARAGVIRAMTAAELQSEDPERLAQRWSQVIERPVVMRDGQRTIALDDATLRIT